MKLLNINPFNEKYKKDTKIFSKRFNIQSIKNFEELQIGKKDLGLDELRKRLEVRIKHIKDNTPIVSEYLSNFLRKKANYKNQYIENSYYVFNIVEFAEMFIWKEGLRPRESLLRRGEKINLNRQNYFFEEAFNYRKRYYKEPLKSFKDSYFYILAEYERVNFDYNEEEFEYNVLSALYGKHKELQREHLFSINLKKKLEIDEKFKEIRNDLEKGRELNYGENLEQRRIEWNYEKWIDNIGNIFLIEENLNKKAQNASIFEKVEIYLDKKEGTKIKGTKDFLGKIRDLKNKLNLDNDIKTFEDIQDQAEQKLAIESFKLMIDIRHYKILEFFAHRF